VAEAPPAPKARQQTSPAAQLADPEHESGRPPWQPPIGAQVEAAPPPRRRQHCSVAVLHIVTPHAIAAPASASAPLSEELVASEVEASLGFASDADALSSVEAPSVVASPVAEPSLEPASPVELSLDVASSRSVGRMTRVALRRVAGDSRVAGVCDAAVGCACVRPVCAFDPERAVGEDANNLRRIERGSPAASQERHEANRSCPSQSHRDVPALQYRDAPARRQSGTVRCGGAPGSVREVARVDAPRVGSDECGARASEGLGSLHVPGADRQALTNRRPSRPTAQQQQAPYDRQ
jgi:hypothetical protein